MALILKVSLEHYIYLLVINIFYCCYSLQDDVFTPRPRSNAISGDASRPKSITYETDVCCISIVWTCLQQGVVIGVSVSEPNINNRMAPD